MRLSGLFLLSVLLFGCVGNGTGAEKELYAPDGKPERYAGRFSNRRVSIPETYAPRRDAMRGVWIATVENIDFQRQQSANSFRQEFRDKIRKLAALKFNTVFFQVRPNNDAFYPSELNPWSRWLTGSEGQGLKGFDPLKFMVDECHANGMEFHAWLNPYRVIGKTELDKNAYLKTLAPGNFARRHPELVLAAPLGGRAKLLFLNPGEPASQRHIIKTVAEILANYNVDAIHFDDYFYPYSNFGAIDADTYKRYGKGRSLADWRRANVNTLIGEVNDTVRFYSRCKGRKIQFGISPFGIWTNRKNNPAGSLTGGKESYSAQFADTRYWVRNNMIDYIIPQLYWNFGHDVAAYAALVDWWCEQARHSNVKLYIGMGAYRMGSRDWRNPDELLNQLKYNSAKREISGEAFFSCRNILTPGNTAMRNCTRKIFAAWKNL